jgi:hypothetical protein
VAKLTAYFGEEHLFSAIRAVVDTGADSTGDIKVPFSCPNGLFEVVCRQEAVQRLVFRHLWCFFPFVSAVDVVQLVRDAHFRVHPEGVPFRIPHVAILRALFQATHAHLTTVDVTNHYFDLVTLCGVVPPNNHADLDDSVALVESVLCASRRKDRTMEGSDEEKRELGEIRFKEDEVHYDRILDHLETLGCTVQVWNAHGGMCNVMWWHDAFLLNWLLTKYPKLDIAKGVLFWLLRGHGNCVPSETQKVFDVLVKHGHTKKVAEALVEASTEPPCNEDCRLLREYVGAIPQVAEQRLATPV